MILLGLALVILGAIFDIGILLTLGWILLIVVALLYIVSAVLVYRGGKSLFGRRKHLF